GIHLHRRENRSAVVVEMRARRRRHVRSDGVLRMHRHHVHAIAGFEVREQEGIIVRRSTVAIRRRAAANDHRTNNESAQGLSQNAHYGPHEVGKTFLWAPRSTAASARFRARLSSHFARKYSPITRRNHSLWYERGSHFSTRSA